LGIGDFFLDSVAESAYLILYMNTDEGIVETNLDKFMKEAGIQSDATWNV
jgi:ribosomal protein L12E/L44/L45/RPP1/RPP2